MTTFALLLSRTTNVLAWPIKSLNDVHFRLEHLEERRRVRELEYELDSGGMQAKAKETLAEEAAGTEGWVVAQRAGRGVGIPCISREEKGADAYVQDYFLLAAEKRTREVYI